MAVSLLSDVRARFVEGAAGPILVVQHIPISERRGVVLIVPPFAEEMNRSRKMLSLQAKQLARRGFEVLLPDLFGTGDSHGTFADARWTIWQEDLAAALSISDLGDNLPVSVLALRLGALLAVDTISARRFLADRLVFWSPCTDGRRFIDQFLRLRTMAAMLTRSGKQESIGELRKKLEEDRLLDVAGYRLPAELTAAIDELTLTNITPVTMPPVNWFEVVTSEEASFPPGSAKIVSGLRDAGRTIATGLTVGPQFWSTPETTIAPNLLAATQSLLADS